MEPDPPRTSNGTYQRIGLLYLHAAADEAFASRLRDHLSPLQSGGAINQIDGRELSEPGAETRGHQVTLLLVSPAALRVGYGNDGPIVQALLRHDRRETRLIPVILTPVNWESTRLRRLQVLPQDGKPATTWPNLDEAFVDVTRGVKRTLDCLPVDVYVNALASGDSVSMAHLGLSYLMGGRVRRNSSKAIAWFEKAAAVGGELAMTLAGHAMKGLDPRRSHHWFTELAKQGSTYAIWELVGNYYHARGVAQDKTAAFEWCRRGAELGHPPCLVAIVGMYLSGDGVSGDDANAFEWGQRGAALGIPMAQVQLGQLYQVGRGVPRDAEAAHSWFEKAMATGDEEALARLREIGYLE